MVRQRDGLTSARWLFISGLSLARPSSFSRQLRLLANHLILRNHRVSLFGLGPGPEDLSRADPTVVDDLIRKHDIQAILLLGYPDQFPFIRQDPAAVGVPVYFWAQLSRPADRDSWGLARPVALTPMTAGYLETAGMRAPIVPHGIDTTVFCPAIHSAAWSGPPVLGTVGVNTHRKRFDRLLEGLSVIRERRWRLEIKTDAETKPGGFDLPTLIHRHGLGTRVKLITDELTDSRMAVFYNHLTLYVHVAEWEGFGIPVAEAMSCGVPVVCSSTQGPGELVPYKDLLVEEGTIVREGPSRLFWMDPTALATAVKLGLDDAPLRERLATEGRLAALSLDITNVADQWTTLLAKDLA